MKDKKPVVLCAFANDLDSYLESLDKEMEGIEDALFDLHDQDILEFQSVTRANIDAIYKKLDRFRDRIAIFHYAGHADGKSLHLNDVNANSEGLADRLGKEKMLQLVFLNGCATKPQVKAFLDSGVKAVIATSVSIDDTKALEFSLEFYTSLAGGANIERAFEEAKSRLITGNKISSEDINIYALSKEAKGIKKYRDLGSILKNDEKMPWGLYIGNITATVYNFGINTETIMKHGEIPILAANEHLVEPVLRAMAKVGDKIAIALTIAYNPKKDFTEGRNCIVEKLPWIIGEEIRVLAITKEKDAKRLKQVLKVYESVVRYLIFILLSQIWNDINNVQLKPTTLQSIDNYLKISSGSFKDFDYFQLLDSLLVEVANNQIPFFIREFESLHKSFEKKDGLHSSFVYLKTIIEKTDIEDIEKECNDSEYYLSFILQNLSYLIKYELCSVLEIQVRKFRHTIPEFIHNNRKLAGQTIESMADNLKVFNFYMESYSVLILKEDENEKIEYLNLSPFLIDTNALQGKNHPNLCFYSFQKNNDSYFFESVERSPAQEFSTNIVDRLPKDQLKKETYTSVMNQFKCVQADFSKLSRVKQ